MQGDNEDMMTVVLASNSCCACCNCFVGFCTVMSVAALISLKQIMDSGEYCTCTTDTWDPSKLSCNQPCSDCFNEEKCGNFVETFQEGYSSVLWELVLQTLLTCGQMFCCMFAAVQVSEAKQKMLSTPFC